MPFTPLLQENKPQTHIGPTLAGYHLPCPLPKGVSTHRDGAGIKEPKLLHPSVERDTFANRMRFCLASVGQTKSLRVSAVTILQSFARMRWWIRLLNFPAKP
jgi:hypothetical protein